MSLVFRAVRHIGQTPEKLKYEIFVEELRIRLCRDSILTLQWIRGPKKYRSTEVIKVSKNEKSIKFNKTLTLLATLFRSKKNPKDYLTKPSKLQILDITDKNSSRVIGECLIDLANYYFSSSSFYCVSSSTSFFSVANDSNSNKNCTTQNEKSTFNNSYLDNRRTLKLTKCLDPTASITFTIKAVHLGYVCDYENEDAESSQERLLSASSFDAPNVTQDEFHNLSANDVLSLYKENENPFLVDIVHSPQSPTSSSANSIQPQELITNEKIVANEEIKIRNEKNREETIEKADKVCNDEIEFKNKIVEKKDALIRRMKDEKLDVIDKLEKSLNALKIKHAEEKSAIEEEIKEKNKQIEFYALQIDILNKQKDDSENRLNEITKELLKVKQKNEKLLNDLKNNFNSFSCNFSSSASLQSSMTSSCSDFSASTDVNLIDSYKSNTVKNDKNTALIDRMIFDLESAKSKCNELENEIENYKAAMLSQKEADGFKIQNLENYIEELEKNVSVKDALVNELQEIENKYKSLQEQFEHENQLRIVAEHELQGLRKDNLDSADLFNYAQKQLLKLQKEVSELKSARNVLQIEREQEVDMQNPSLNALQSDVERLIKTINKNKAKFEAEKTWMRNRIKSLEEEVEKLLSSKGKKVQNESEKYAEIAANYNKKVLNIQSTDNSSLDKIDTHAKRLLELEDELISTKLDLAESRTKYEEEINECRTRFIAMRNQLDEYSNIVSRFEMNRSLKYSGEVSSKSKNKHNNKSKEVTEEEEKEGEKEGEKEVEKEKEKRFHMPSFKVIFNSSFLGKNYAKENLKKSDSFPRNLTDQHFIRECNGADNTSIVYKKNKRNQVEDKICVLVP